MEQIVKTREWHRVNRWASQEFRNEPFPNVGQQRHPWTNPTCGTLTAVRLMPDLLSALVPRHAVSCSFVWLQPADRRRFTVQTTELGTWRHSTPAYRTAQSATSSYTFHPALADLNTATRLSHFTAYYAFFTTSGERSLMLKSHYCATQQRLHRLSDVHKTFCRSFYTIHSLIRLCFREKSGSDINILLYGTNKHISVLCIFLDPSRWNSV